MRYPAVQSHDGMPRITWCHRLSQKVTVAHRGRRTKLVCFNNLVQSHDANPWGRPGVMGTRYHRPPVVGSG